MAAFTPSSQTAASGVFEVSEMNSCPRRATIRVAFPSQVAEDAVMPVTTIRLRKESKEQKNIAHSYAVVAKMSLGSASLTESTVPAFEHWIMMAESLPPQLPLR